MTLLKEGDTAPDFALKDQNGKNHKLSDYKEKKVILYFYPKDMTPGCTKEACNFRDNFSEFEERGIAVLGVSADTEESHKKFEQMFGLNFSLLADTQKEVVKKYGVFGEKKFMGRTFIGISRTTFIIDENRKILKIFHEVNVSRHAHDILEFLSDEH